MPRGKYGRAQGAGTSDPKAGTESTGGPKAGTESTGGFDWGNFIKFGGNMLSGRKQGQIAEENRKWQEEQNTLAYKRSLPWNVSGPGGTVEFDEETKQILQTLSPEMQGIMNQWLGASQTSADELASFAGDPYAMEQQQFQRFEDLNKNAYARSRAQGAEARIAQGREGTQGYYDQLAIEDAINQSRLGGQMQAMNTGMDYRRMLSAENQGFGQNAMNMSGMLNAQADLGSMVGSRTKPGANMAGLSLAGTNYADTKSGFWSGMNDQAAQYNNQGNMTQAGQSGWLSGLMDAGKQFYSWLA